MNIALLVSIPFLWHGLKWYGLKSTKRTLATAKRDKSAVISEISERILKGAYAGKDELSRIDLSYRTLLSIFYSIVRFYFTRYFLLCQCWVYRCSHLLLFSFSRGIPFKTGLSTTVVRSAYGSGSQAACINF